MGLSFFLFVMCWVTISRGVSLSWLSGINTVFSARNLLSQNTDITPDLIHTITNGVQLAVNHCQFMFKWDRWNCPESAFARHRVQPPTREQAFAQAILSAGLIHTITRNCSQGNIRGCSCDPKLSRLRPTNQPEGGITYSSPSYSVLGKTRRVDWSWGGCSDDTEYAELTAKIILDEKGSGGDPQAYITNHNNLVGTAVVRDTMVRRCRCHGISGSCSLQTCWMQVASFEKIANVLKQHYKKALRIDVENRIRRFSVSTSATEISENALPISSHQLVYLQDSPNYCRFNNTTGWPGTKGRTCSRSRSETTGVAEKRSCTNLCRRCGYRVRKQKRQVTWKCNCSFIWCCEVECQTCTKMVEEFFCQ